jgi:hypothetical protein
MLTWFLTVVEHYTSFNLTALFLSLCVAYRTKEGTCSLLISRRVKRNRELCSKAVASLHVKHNSQLDNVPNFHDQLHYRTVLRYWRNESDRRITITCNISRTCTLPNRPVTLTFRIYPWLYLVDVIHSPYACGTASAKHFVAGIDLRGCRWCEYYWAVNFIKFHSCIRFISDCISRGLM